MLFKCYCRSSPERMAARLKRFEDVLQPQLSWHRWFAWRPVSFGNGVCGWLQYVERIRTMQHDISTERSFYVKYAWGVSWGHSKYRLPPSGRGDV